MTAIAKAAVQISLVFAFGASAFGAEYYQYASGQADNVLDLVKTSKVLRYKLIENTPYCRKTPGLYGYVQYPDPVRYGAAGTYGICSRRIIQEGSQSQFNRVVFHESVHAAQGCHPRAWLLGIPQASIPQDLKAWVRQSPLYQGNNEESNKAEYEAYYLEDFPDRVTSEVRAQCHR